MVGYALGNAPGSLHLGRLWTNGVEKALPVGISGQSTAAAVAFVGSTPVVAGHYPNSTGPLNGYHDPKLWHDGVTPQALSTSVVGSHVPSGIQSTASGVHVAGTKDDAYRKAVYWKNGQVQYLTNVEDSTYEATTGLTVSDEDVVYISGHDFATAGSVTFKPVYWRNGEKFRLGALPGSATGVATRGFDVYVSGTVTFPDSAGASTAVVWKNGSVERQSMGSVDTAGYAVAAGGLDDVYVAGAVNVQSSSVRAALWKNGVEQTLEGANAGSEARAVKVVGSDVYVAGHVGSSDGRKQRAALWVNGTLHVLSDGSSMAWSTGLAVR